MPGKPPAKADVSRVQSAQAKSNNDTGKGSFPDCLRSTQAQHENAANQGSANQGKQTGLRLFVFKKNNN
ncbi:hypothetical protein HPULCUR_008317 [Helicostylum pulchrum]|uniref:Uncharacterized protein n=1 Tax=Helicostylum pulchrum TaxID=562976 RepID=A0ABP9Y794_9FUNG